MSTVDWPTIRAAYLSGTKPQQLSEQFNVPYETIRSHIKTEKWRMAKTETDRKTTQKQIEKYTEKLVSRQLEIKDQYAKGNQKLATVILKTLQVTTDPKDIAALTRAYNEARRGVFACYDIPETTRIQGDPDKPLQHITTHEIPMAVKKELVALFIARQQ